MILKERRETMNHSINSKQTRAKQITFIPVPFIRDNVHNGSMMDIIRYERGVL